MFANAAGALAVIAQRKEDAAHVLAIGFMSSASRLLDAVEPDDKIRVFQAYRDALPEGDRDRALLARIVGGPETVEVVERAQAIVREGRESEISEADAAAGPAVRLRF